MKISTPIDKKTIAEFRSGDALLLTGVLYTARDAAHKKLVELIEQGAELPFPLEGAVIYYTGPSPTKPGDIVGSIGPTTSYRMDRDTPILLEKGVAMTIGKGRRGEEVLEAIVRSKAVYCAAYGGAGALLASKVRSIETVAFAELGPEAIFRIEVEDFPVTVINDIYGNDLYRHEGEEDDQ